MSTGQSNQKPFTEFLALGWNPIPLIRGCKEKRPDPSLGKWKVWQERFITPFQAKVYDESRDKNVGIVTGKLSNLVVIDADGPAALDTLKSKATDLKTPTVKTGKGYHYYYTYPKAIDFTLAGFVRQTKQGNIFDDLDLRAEGNYITAPPSIHETGATYEWLPGLSPWEIELKPCPIWIIEEQRPKPIPVTAALVAGGGDISDKYIEAALLAEERAVQLAAPNTRNTTLNAAAFKLAQLIHNGLSEDVIIKRLANAAAAIGLSSWEAAATIQSGLRAGKQQPREVPEKDALKAYGLVRKDCAGAAGIGQRLIEAKENGLAHDKTSPLTNLKGIIADEAINNHPIIPQTNVNKNMQNENEMGADIEPSLVLQAPGLVGQLCQWFNETARLPQPLLALGAALPVVGLLMGRKVQTGSNLRSNIMTINVAPSGAGKEHANQMTLALFAALGQGHLCRGEPVSGSALESIMADNKGVALISIDEFGRYLEIMNGRKSANFQRQVFLKMINMYNCAPGIYQGQEFADNEAHGGRKLIDQPVLCIHGTTVPSRLYKNLQSEDTLDGLAARWLIFHSSRFDIDAKTYDAIAKEPPPELLDACHYWLNQPTNINPQGNIDKAINPRIVDMSPPAKEFTIDFFRHTRRIAANAFKNGDMATSSVFNRTSEMAQKLALLGHDGDQIDINVAEWGAKLANWCASYMVAAFQSHISDNVTEAEHKKLLRVVQVSGEISATDLARKTQWVKNRQARHDMLATLVESGQLLAEDRGEGKVKKRFYFLPDS